MKNTILGGLVGLVAVSGAHTASAHISMNVVDGASHDARWNNVYTSKDGPCGVSSGASRMTYTYTAGETITVTVVESIPHPGYFRIAFDSDGTDDFLDPRWIVTDPATRQGGCPINDFDQCRPTGEGDFFNTPDVLLDDLDLHQTAAPGTTYSWQVTLPDTPCDKCTLQIIQVMFDPFGHGEYNTSPGQNSDVYHQCIDMVLLPNATQTGGSMAGSGGEGATGGSGSTGGVAATGGILITGGATASGGALETGGVFASGGVVTSGGILGSGGALAGGTLGGGGTVPPTATTSSGCSVRGEGRSEAFLSLALAALATVAVRRRKR